MDPDDRERGLVWIRRMRRDLNPARCLDEVDSPPVDDDAASSDVPLSGDDGDGLVF